MPFDHPMPANAEIDSEPFILIFDGGIDVSGGVYFPQSRFSLAEMQRFAANFNLFIEALLESSDIPIHDISLL